MQNKQHPTRTLVRLCGLSIGALGFGLSFVMAMAMLVRQGNPGFLLVWSAAVLATGICLRIQYRWGKSFERMYAPEVSRTFHPARKGWRQNVEDIAFRDVSDASVSLGQ